jgi:hypothetical protein
MSDVPMPSPGAARVAAWASIATDPTWPRAGLLGLWAFSPLLRRAYGNPVVPVVGFLIVPWSTLYYAFTCGRRRPPGR